MSLLRSSMPQPHKYIWAELTKESKKLLESLLPYRYEKSFGTHITIDWDTDFSVYSDLIGKKFKLVVNSLVFDENCEAIPVNLSGSGLRSVNKNPHITWSCKKEINPYYSNYLLYISKQNTSFEPVEIEVEIKAG
jgi:hypothetical protein